MTTLSERRLVTLIFVLALAVRLAFALLITLRYPIVFDGAEVASIAINVVQGHGFSSPFGQGDTPTAHMAPLIPLLWAGVFRFFGILTSTSATVILLMQSVVSAVSVAIYTLVALRLRARWALLPRSTPLIVGSVLALWPESLLNLSDLWYYQWQEAALALMILQGIIWLDNPASKQAVKLGLSAGILALINPVSVSALAPLLAVPLLVARRIRVERVRTAGLCVCVVALMILPWTTRNYLVFGQVIPVRGNFGLELLQGNHPDAGVLQHSRSFHPAGRPDAKAIYTALGEPAYGQWAQQQAFAYIGEHPQETAALILKRIAVFWLTDVFDHYRWSPDSPRWWQACCGINKVRRASTIVAALLPLAIILWALPSGLLRSLPYKPAFAGVFFLYPLPYYVTLANYQYGMAVRAWLGVVAVVTLIAARQMRQIGTHPVRLPAPDDDVSRVLRRLDVRFTPWCW